jgi:hypothetical protein
MDGVPYVQGEYGGIEFQPLYGGANSGTLISSDGFE